MTHGWALLTYDKFVRFLDDVLEGMQPLETHGLLCVSGHRAELKGSSFESDLARHLGVDDRLSLTNKGDYLTLIQNTTANAALRLTRLARYAFEHSKNSGSDRTAAFGLVLFKTTGKRSLELIAIAEQAAKTAETATRNRIKLIELTDEGTEK